MGSGSPIARFAIYRVHHTEPKCPRYLLVCCFTGLAQSLQAYRYVMLRVPPTLRVHSTNYTSEYSSRNTRTSYVWNYSVSPTRRIGSTCKYLRIRHDQQLPVLVRGVTSFSWGNSFRNPRRSRKISSEGPEVDETMRL